MLASGGGRFHERFVVGWFERSEWREVCNYLYSDDLNKQIHAVGRIAVWKSRMMTQLPLAVECTGSIIQAVIEDKSAIENSTINEKDLPIRMNYSTALVRFVSLLTEKLQKKTLAQPMHKLAEALGMPFWMVELRHNAAHGTLPSLQMLRSGAHTALDWLKKEYWDVERMAKAVAYDTQPQEDRETDVEDTLVQYLQESYTALSLTDAMVSSSAEKRGRHSGESGLSKLIRLHKRDSKTLIKCLLKDGYLVPEEEQLLALNVDIESYLQSGTLGLPLSLVEMWSELLPELNHTMSLLLVRAMSEARSAEPLRRKLLYSWVALILESLAPRAGDTDGSGLLYFVKPPLIDYYALLDTVVKSPNDENRELVPRILSGIQPRLRRQQKNHILQLTDLLLAKKDSTRSKTKKKRLKNVKGLGDLRQRMENALEKLDKAKQSTSTADTTTTKEPDYWRRADESLNWGEYPFGLCPGVKITSRNLELGQCNVRDSELDDKEDESSETDSSVTMETDDDDDDDESSRNGEWSQDVFDQIRSRVEPLL